MLGLRFCARAFSSCGKWGPLFIAVRGPLTIAASLVAEHRLQTRRLSSCGSRGQLLRGMWDHPRPGLEPVSPALADRFSTTAPPGKPYIFFNSSIIDWQCCVNFCCTAKWFGYTHIYILFLIYSFPLWFIIGFWIWFSVLYSRTLLFIHFIYNSLHLLTSISHSIPPPIPSPVATTSLFSMFLSPLLFSR